MNCWDFRSDTVTQPTPQMRQAMAAAVVGDDVYRDDPTVNELEQLSAQLLGKEAALLVPSGTFANQLALQLHCQPGDEVLLSEQCHIVQHETGGAAALAGVQLRCLDAPDGFMPPEQLQQRLRSSVNWSADCDVHQPQTRLLCLENAFSSGQVLSLEQLAQMSGFARATGLKVYLDGARIFNAAVHLGCDASAIASCADTVMFCLSKGLCAPVGSMLLGSRQDIERARILRKRMGGGMRQAGILAAAGLIALREMRLRLAEDHQRARHLADLLEQKIPGTQVARQCLDINMVFARIPGLNAAICAALAQEEQIFIGAPDENDSVRLITHYWTPFEAIDHMVSRLRNKLL